jgi:Na+/melibiose symporter-like transporter
MLGHLLSPAIAFVVTPLLARRHNKRNVWIWTSIAATVSLAAPLALRTMGLFPDNGHPFVFPFLLVNDILNIALLVITLNASMLMDVVEARELETGRREEGVIAAVRSFAMKASLALGTVVAGLALDFIAFPVQTAVGEVPEEAITSIGLLYGPILAILSFASISMLYFYQIDRQTHLDNLEKLERRSSNK